MYLAEAIESYLLYAQHEQRVARRTYLTYTSWLRHFHEWMTANGYETPTLNDVNPLVLRRYLYSLSEKGLRPRSVRSCFYPIRSMCSYLVKTGIMQTNPVLQVTMPKLDATQRKMTTDTDILAIFRACEKLPTVRKIALTRGVLSILIYAGLRRTELCDLKLDDVNLQEGWLIVRRGKGDKARKVFLCLDCQQALREWLAVREHDTQSPYLFTLNRYRRVHYDAVYGMLEAVKSIAGLAHDKALLPHSLRHAAATRLLRNGVDLSTIQTFLGHENLETTAIYLHSDEERMQQTARRELDAQRGESLTRPNLTTRHSHSQGKGVSLYPRAFLHSPQNNMTLGGCVAIPRTYYRETRGYILCGNHICMVLNSLTSGS